MNSNNLEVIIEKYGFNKPIRFKLLREGIDNDVYLIHNENTKAIIRISKRNMAGSLEYEADLINSLRRLNIPVPVIIRTLKGEFFLTIEDTVVTCFEYIDHDETIVSTNNKPEISIIKQTGAMLGRLHSESSLIQLKNSKRRTIYTEIDRALQIKNTLLVKLGGGKEYVKLLEQYKKYAQNTSSSLPAGIIHNDYVPGNILFKQDKLVAIIDFDWACYAPLIKDVGLALAVWSYPDGATNYWKDIFAAFIDSYNKESPHKILENDDLIRWICFSCISDSATYFADLAVGNPGISNVLQSRSYKRFIYFEKMLT